MDTRIQQQVQHWQRVRPEADINFIIVDSVAKPVNPLLGLLDESFEWNASIKLHGSPGRWLTGGDLQCVFLAAAGCILIIIIIIV